MSKVSKKEFLSLMAEKSGLSQKDCDVALKAFEECVISFLVSGREIQIQGFLTFKVGQQAARDQKVPNSDKIVHIPARKIPKFRAGNKLKEAIAGV